ncbi:MAG TPA: hypothetical protein VF612_16175 [Jatrophihabitans sp.]|jgi:hypothetical protein|uniref:hypothetical protein n=1 Tax=Jatrophihabitans sp. TaxID=1932789 RepID=UPI002EE2B2A9
MRLLFWKRSKPADRNTALRALQSLKRDRLLRPAADPTPGSVNDEYYATQAGGGS